MVEPDSGNLVVDVATTGGVFVWKGGSVRLESLKLGFVM